MSEANGQHPPGLTWQNVLEVISRSDNHAIFVQALGNAVAEAGAACLFRQTIQQRCAAIAVADPDLYRGSLLELVSQAAPKRWHDWEKEVQALTLGLADLDIVPLSQIEEETITWLWEPYIPHNKLTLFEGDPGSGKTYLLMTIAAAVTRGWSLPDQQGTVAPGDGQRAGNVLYITAEDGLADTIKKRGRATGADQERLFVPRKITAFSLTQPDALCRAIGRYRPRLLVLDPLQAFLGGQIDMHKANEVRPLMTTLAQMADDYQCAIVAIRHWTKAPGGRARYRGQGNIDFTAAARSAISVGESPEDDRYKIMAQNKSNNSRFGISMVFQITDEGLHWCGTSTLTADELSAAQPKRHATQRQTAMEWLREYLKQGPQPAELILHEAEAVGIPERTLRRAKEHLRILAAKDREKGIWFWRLPTFQKWERYPGYEDDD